MVCWSLWASLELFISLFYSLSSVTEGFQWSFSLCFWVQQGHCAFSIQHWVSSPSQLVQAPRPIHLDSDFATQAAQGTSQMPRLYPRKTCNEWFFCSEIQLSPNLFGVSLSHPTTQLYTLVLGPRHWALSQRQPMATLVIVIQQFSHHQQEKKICTSYSICEEIIFTIMVPSLPLGFLCKLFSVSNLALDIKNKGFRIKDNLQKKNPSSVSLTLFHSALKSFYSQIIASVMYF